MDKDIDLQKIQLIESNYQTWFNFVASIVAGSLIGGVIFISTLYAENVINFAGFFLASILAFGIVGSGITYLNKQRRKHVRFINELMVSVEKGESLKSISELEKLSHKEMK